MENKLITIETSIGQIDYLLQANIFYKEEGKRSLDPTEDQPEEIVAVKIASIQAYDYNTEKNYFVEDKDEVAMVRGWINWAEELNSALN